MAEQQQLDLPPPPRAIAAPPRRGFGGFDVAQLAGGALVLAVLVWGVWVTHTITKPRQEHIVSARLSALVGEYVTAEARSASPPAQVQAEMRAFMAGLASELQRRSARGEVVLVGEAVLTKNVPDITDELKRAVYASGVPTPHQASAAELQRFQSVDPATAAAASMPGATPAPAAAAAAPVFAAPPASPPAPAGSGALPGGRAPSIANLGGPNGDGGH